MKHLYATKLVALTLTLFLIESANSQSCTTFTVESNLESPSQMITCDFNGDGFQDIVFLDSLNNNVWWKRNLSDASFAAAEPLVGGAEILFLRTADLNNDAFEEIIIATLFDVFYVQYLSPTTIDFRLILSAPGLNRIKAIAVGDFNNDNFDGFAIAYNSSSGIYALIDVITNNKGTLGTKNLLDGTFGIISDLAVGDIDKNGYIDVATSGYNNLWFSNSNLNFSSDKLIRSASSSYGRIFLMDYNNDNNLELVNLNNDGLLQSFRIDPNGISLYSPVTLLSGLPKSVSIWQRARINGNEMILTGSANEIIGLENAGNTFVNTSICSGITDLNGATQMRQKNGDAQLFFSRGSQKTIERIDVPIGLEETHATAFRIYPNPSPSVFQIQTAENQLVKSLRMVNGLGQAMNPKRIGANEFDISTFPAGLYQVIIEDQFGDITTQSFLKIE